ncbi:methyltransferase [Acidovorax sp. CCYZU-2555]|uniref:class I SAM-dependent methyltransferase n=1 Tax=Acidovorax sp. CCYZU-2555 TaxID=2835042 RepID=UPI001BCE8896|nr:methyltransferase [Acidovorax sp. CCYZU-2555]MBS7780852.1 methyltransferase [Acidovorax sp. CCYZU-2555]
MSGYLTKQESIAVHGVEHLTIRSLLDKQQFHDPQGEAEQLGISDAFWPLFGLLWPSGEQLAACVAARPRVAGERILELGCGLGLASLVCHRRGDDITASDCHPMAGAFMRENLRLNQLPPMKFRIGHWGATHTDQTAYERMDIADRDHEDLAHGVRSLPLDYQSATNEQSEVWAVDGRFDLIVGSDLLYERDVRATLPIYIESHCTPAAQIWVVDPDRGNRSAFSRQMAELGFGVEEQRLDRAASELLPAYKGRLLKYQR